MQSVLIVGAGKGGTAILKMILELESLKIDGMVDIDEHATGLKYAKKHNIRTETDWRRLLTSDIDVVIEATGNEKVFEEIREHRSKQTVLIPGSVAHIISNLIEEKEELITELTNQSYLQDIILNSTHDGMIAINKKHEIILLNESAERLMGLEKEKVIGKNINDVFHQSELPRVIKTKKIEVNQEVLLTNGKKVITTRIPMVNDNGEVIGAFSVFKDITEVVTLAEELTNLKDIRTMLEAIIHSSEEAISVVDEHGNGIMINPAYTRITGLTEDQVIGKPATIDISEGESVHMKVLQTRKPIRGERMKVGPTKRDVIVNVAPVIVDGKLKGSIGVIHDVSEIKALTNELKRARQIIRTLEAKYTFDDIIGDSEEMKFAIEQAKLGARTPATVLLRGESGTGKELFAHAIHNGSDRKFNKFIRVNCAAISESLLESELFGYEEGAFSGASRGGKRGLFEEANNGSIFLDEIGELSLNTQAKLLRVLQESEIVRVGGTKPIPIKVRVIAATNVNLEKGIANKTIREDLYYRLNRLPIQVPSLRKRKDDIPLLCEHLIRKINQDYGRNVEGITDEAIAILLKYDWPGNVRELENILGRAVINMQFNEVIIDVHHIPAFMNEIEKSSDSMAITIGAIENNHLSSMVEKYEKSIISSVLTQHKGNKTKTAKALGLSIRNLYYKIKKLNIDDKF